MMWFHYKFQLFLIKRLSLKQICLTFNYDVPSQQSIVPNKSGWIQIKFIIWLSLYRNKNIPYVSGWLSSILNSSSSGNVEMNESG